MLLFGYSSSHAALTTDRAWLREARQGISGGEGVRYSGADGYRGKVRAPCILSLHVARGQKGGWSLVSVTVRQKTGVGGILPCSLPLCSYSPAHVHNEVMRDRGLLQTQARWGEDSSPQLLSRAH